MFECHLEPWEKLPENFDTLAPLIQKICFPLLPENPEVGQYYRIYPQNCFSGNGTAYHGNVRIGRNPKKLLVFLNGGGVSFDEYTAARPNNAFTLHIPDTYYSNDGEWIGDYFLREGMNAQREDNPFLDWSIIHILYCNGDFHCGDGEFPYTAQDGSRRMMRYHGYRNAMAVISAAKQLLPDPDQLLIAGSSAGGFGASLLADDIIQQFPSCDHITCCVDSALILSDRWRDIAAHVWHSPSHIVERLTSNNLTLDHLTALHVKYGDRVKILFMSSVRDAMLAAAENALQGNGQKAEEKDGIRYQENLKQMCADLISAIPHVGLYIFTAPMDAPGWDETLTLHCGLNNYYLFEAHEETPSVCEWLLHAVEEDRLDRIGLSLLDMEQKRGNWHVFI